MIEQYFSFIFNRVMIPDWCRNFVYAQYLVDQLMDFDNILLMHWYWQNVGKDNDKLFFVIFQLSNGPWLMSEFYFHLISWERFNGFWWNFVYAVLWPTHEIFPNFSTELWPLIDVRISFFLDIFRNNEAILIKFCLCIDIYDVVTNTHYFPELFNRVMTLDWF